MVKAIVESDNSVLQRKAEPAIFWANALSNTELPWAPSIKSFVESAFCIPHGSTLPEIGLKTLYIVQRKSIYMKLQG
jgi:hypothetical protein